jgi:serine/threonine protein kinase
MDLRSNHRTLQLFCSVALELNLLHGRGLVHGALSPEKVLAGFNKFGHAEVDILEKEFAGRMKYIIFTRVSPYAAPENRHPNKAFESRDIYSLGLIFYEALTGQKAFFRLHITLNDQIALYKSLKDRDNPALLSKAGKDSWCWDILAKMTCPGSQERISSTELKDELFELYLAHQPVVDIFGMPTIQINSRMIQHEMELGRGGCAVVSLVEARCGQQTVRLVRKRALMTGDQEHDQIARELLEKEYQALPKGDEYSPYVVKALGRGVENGVPYIDLEYVEGIDLDKYLEDDGYSPVRLGVREVVQIGLQVAEGLNYIHEKGYVHGDIKPLNLMRRIKDGRIKIIDLGIVRLHMPRLNYSTLYATEDWAAAEQLMGKSDSRSDIWSLGLVLASLIKGRQLLILEYDGANPNWEKFFADQQNIGVEIDALTVEGLSTQAEIQLKYILRKMLAFDVEQRYQNAEEVVADLQELEALL